MGMFHSPEASILGEGLTTLLQIFYLISGFELVLNTGFTAMALVSVSTIYVLLCTFSVVLNKIRTSHHRVYIRR